MVASTMDLLGWLGKHLGAADPDLLRELVVALSWCWDRRPPPTRSNMPCRQGEADIWSASIILTPAILPSARSCFAHADIRGVGNARHG